MCDLDLLKKSISEDAKVALMNNLGSQNFERPKPNQALVYTGDNASVTSIADNIVSSWASKRFGPKFSANWVQTQRDNNRTLIDVRIPEILDLALNVKYGGTSLQTANNILNGLDEDDSEISLSGYGKPSVESKNLDKRFNSTLQNRLVEFIEGLNIEVAIDPEVLKTFTVKGQNPRTAFDLLQKYLALPSDVTDKEVSLQTANIIYQFLGKKSILQTNLRASIENWSKYDEVYKKYKTKGVSHSFAKKQATLQFLAEIIELGATQNFNVESIENIDVDKNYFSRLGYKNPYEINAFKRLLNIVWNWINEHILRNKVNFILKEQELKNLAMDIVNDVYQKDYKKFIRKYADVDGKIIDLSTGEELEQKYYEETLNKDPFAKSIILSFFNNPFMDYKLSGSQVVRKYGKLLRALSEDLHDIDGIITLEQMRKEGNYLEMINWIDQRGLKLSNSNRTKTFKRELTKFLEEQSWYKNLKSLYPEWELKEAFIGRDHKDGESITITGIIPHPTEIDPETGKKKEYIIDFFVRTKEGSYPEIFDNYWKDWKQIFEAKVNMGRAKDINDLIYFEPFRKDKYKFTNRGFRYFTMESEQRKDSNLIEEEVTEVFESNPDTQKRQYQKLGSQELDRVQYLDELVEKQLAEGTKALVEMGAATTKGNETARATEGLSKLVDQINNFAQRTGVEYEILSTVEEAANVIGNANTIGGLSANSIIASGAPAFFYNGKVYFIAPRLSMSAVFHEFSHPIIKALSNVEGKKLFNSLYEQAIGTSEGQQIQNQMLSEFPEGSQETDDFKEELIIRALDKIYSANKYKNPVSKDFNSFTNKLFFAIKQFLRKVFGIKIKVEKLSSSTTLEELAAMITGDKFSIDIPKITREDFVAFNMAQQNQISEINKINDQSLYDLIDAYQITLSRIRSDINTKNLTELKKLLIGKEDNKMILSEILSDLYSAKKNSEEFIRSTTTTVLAETQKTLASNTLARNLESISNIADILQKSIENINSNNLSVEDQKAFAGKIQYAGEIVSYLKELFKITQLAMKEAGIKDDTPEWQTITLFFGKVPALEDAINAKMISILSEVTFSLVTDMRESVMRQAIADLKKAISNNPTIQQKIENGFEDLTDADLSNIDSKVQATILRSYKNFKSDYDAISKEALNDILSGNYKDNSKLNTLLESYTNNQNPVIGSFAAFYKQQRASAEALTVRETANFMEGLRRLIENMSQQEVANLGNDIAFEDKTFIINKDGDVEEKIVLTYLNRFKNYRFELKKREVAFEKANRDGTYAEKSAAYQELQDFKRKYFWQEYSQDYYNLDKIYQEIDAEDLDALYEEDKDLYEIRPDGVYFEGKALENPNSLNNVALIKEHITNTIGSTAFLDKQVILDNLNATQRSARTETELFEKNNEIEALQRTYRQLFSLTYEDGVTLKTGKDLIKTKLHIKYREKSNSFVEYKLIEGAFERSLRNFLDELALRETPGTDEYYKQRDEWIRQNSQIEFTNDYYEERRKAIEKLKAFTESKLPDSPEAKLIAENYKIIYSILSIFKDTDNAPDALDMGPKRIANIKRLMEEIQEARSNMAIKSGLTKKEDIELQSLWEQIKSGNPLNGLQQRRFDELSKKKVTGGLSKTDKNTYNKLIAEVAGFTEKVPTQQYLDSLNYWLNTRLSLGLSEVTEENANMYLSYDKIAPYLRMDSEFKDWFEANHILTEYYDYDLEDTVYVYKRVSAWEMSRPADEDYLKQTELNIIDEKTGKPMVLKRVPKSRFKKRVVKDEFRLVKENEDWTMYIGKYFDNRGRYLPRDYVPGDPNSAEDDFLINEKYDELRVNDPKKFAILEYMKQQQLKEESKLEQNYAKLYLDLPRYYLKTGIERRKDIRQSIKRQAETVKRAFSNAKVNDDVAAELLVDETLNISEDLAFVETDILGNRREVIPIGGMTALETNQVSKDVVRGHLKRMIDIAEFNVLQDTAPVAKAFVSTLNENKPKDMNSIDRKLYQNRGKLAFTKSKSKSNVAGEAMAYFYEREYLGKKNAEEVNPYVDQLVKGLMKQVSFGYFALDLASAAKNYFSQLIQNGIETAGGEYIDVQSLAMGKAMAYAHTSKNLFQRLDRGSKDLSTQMILAFEPIQDRYQDDFADSYTNSIWNELASLKFFMAPRRFLERESVLELFFAMMSKKLIDQKISDDKTIKIRYSEAFETDSDGNMVLKKGVDERYAVGGSEFAKFRILVQEKSNLLYGTYAKMDQPMAQKYFAFRLMSWLRRYFTSMIINRWGFKLKPGGKIYKASSYQYRYNWALNEMTRGYYIESMIALTKTLRTVGAYAPYMSKREAVAIRKTLYDALAAILLAMLPKLLFGYDGDDKERFEKLRKLSGPLGSDNFKLDGWLTQHAIYQMKAVFAETTTFVPLPGLGEQEILDVGTVSNVLLGRGIGNYTTLIMDLFYISTGNQRASYKRDMGPFPWQDKGDYKIYNHLAKMFGVKGKFWDPVLAIKAQETIEAMGQAR